MPECLNCGSYVSKDYARVKADNVSTVPACSKCEDAKIQDGKKYDYRG